MVGGCQPHPGQPWVGDCHPVAGRYQPHRDPFMDKGTFARALSPAVLGTSPSPLSHPQEGAGAAPLQLCSAGSVCTDVPRIHAWVPEGSTPPLQPLISLFGCLFRPLPQIPSGTLSLPNPSWDWPQPPQSHYSRCACAGGPGLCPQPQGRENCIPGGHKTCPHPLRGSHCDTAPARAALTD